MKRQTSLARKYNKQDQKKKMETRKVIGFKSKDEKGEVEFVNTNSPGRKQLNCDFKEIKDEICNIKGEIDQYFGEKMTNSCKQLQRGETPSSPISLIHGSSPRLEVSIVSDAFSSSVSSNDENLYKIKFKLISEQLQSMKRKYYLRKIEHKQLISKLCKKISSLEKMAKNKDYDLQQYKRILGKQVSSIKQQINSCIQNQMTSTIIQTSREEPNYDYNHHSLNKMQFSQILNPEYQTSSQVLKLRSLLDQKDLILSQSQQELQKLKFQNLELQNLLQTKQKSQLLLQQTLQKQQQLSLTNLKEQLTNQRFNSQDYRLRFQDLSKIRQLQYQQTQDQQHYLRLQLQHSLAREADCQTRFRDIDTQRRELNNKDMDVLRNELAKKNSELIQMKAQLKIKDEEITFLNQKIQKKFACSEEELQQLNNDIKQKQKQYCTPKNNTFINIPTLKLIETTKLQQQNSQLHEALSKTNATISELKSSYEQQLYSLEIQYRRKNMEYEDKLKQFMKMIGAEVSDLMLRQQDYQLVQKQQQLQRANTLLSEAQLKICVLEGEIKTLQHNNFINPIAPHKQCIHQTSVLQFQNNYLKISIFSLCNKISILSSNQKKAQILLTTKDQTQLLFKNLFINVPTNFSQKFNDEIEIIKKLKEQNYQLLEKINKVQSNAC